MAKTGTQGTTAATPSRGRHEELKRMLDERQRELAAELQGKIRGVRADGAEKPHERMDLGETGEIDQQDIDLALIQMKAETLNKINEARRRLEEHQYGMCFECGDEIAEARLRALPFAVRCRDCEEEREMETERERAMARRRGASNLFDDLRG